MKEQMNYSPIDISSLLEPPKTELTPLLTMEQTVYVISLDRVLPAKVNEIYTVGKDNANPYLGYRLRYESGIYDCAWDYSIGDWLFTDETQAQVQAGKCHIPKYTPTSTAFTGILSFKYTRMIDGHALKAFLAKIGDTKLYEKDFMCYAFLKKYKSISERDKAYKKMAGKITDEANRNNGEQCGDYIPETLYYVTEELYSSREYAERHTQFPDVHQRW